MKKILLITTLLQSFIFNAQDGALDLSFGNNGKVITSISSGEDKARSVALQDDGKIIVAGYSYSSVFGYDFSCARYNTDGSLDSNFGNNGKVTYDLQGGSDDKAFSIDIQLDGKIVIAGYSDDGSDRAGAVIRLNSDGSLDNTFNSTGKVFTNFTIYNSNPRTDEFKVVKIHHVTGNIVVGGTCIFNSNESRAIFARYNSSGQLDTSFADNGKLIDLPFPESNSIGFMFAIEDLKIKSNGKITAIGWSDIPGNGSLLYARQYVCRLNSNGTLDTTFSSDGYSSNSFTTSDNKSYSILLNPDDTSIFSGSSRWSSTNYKFYFGTVSNSGTVNSQGSVDFSSNTIDMCYSMAKDLDNKIILSGSSINTSTNTSTFSIARINSNYSIDTTFGTSGLVTTDFGSNSYSESYDSVIQSDGKIILVGYTGNDIALARYIGSSTLSNIDFSNNNNTISLFPNPTSDFLILNNFDQIHKSDFYIYDYNSRLVKNGIIDNSDNKIFVEDLKNGIYFIEIGDQVLKFIKK
jgi:uncharacterized delta-60 repeat protein